jgi:YD repeat-containing protein
MKKMNSKQKIRILQMLLQVVSEFPSSQTNIDSEEQTAQVELALDILGKLLHEQPALDMASGAAVNETQPCKGCQKSSAAVVRPLLTTDSVTYTIDSLGRLTKLTYANGTTITYNYDAMGNRTSVVTACGGSGC